MRRIKTLLKFSGAAAALVYIVMTLISHLNYPEATGPFTNWLSEYGNPASNPAGAVFYNIGCIIVAALLAAFYIGMTRWHNGAPVKLVVCYICAEISGLFAAVCLVLASLTPIGTSPAHETFSMLNMIGMDSFLMFTAIAAFINPYVSSGLGVLGVIAAAFNIFAANVLGKTYVAEWIFFAAFIVFVILLTVNYERFRGENIKAAQEEAAGLAQ